MNKNAISDILKKMQYNFKDISELKPEDKNYNSLSMYNYVNDKTVHNFNPKRYNFYIQFIEALNNPELIKNFLYSNTIIKAKKEAEMNNIRNIVNGLQKLYMIKPDNNEQPNDYNSRKKEKRNKINQNVIGRINNLMSSDIDNSNSNKPIINNIIKNTFDDPHIPTTGGGADDNVSHINTDNNIVGLFYDKMTSDINQITDNLNFIRQKKIKIDEFLEKKKNNEKYYTNETSLNIIKDPKDLMKLDMGDVLEKATGLSNDPINSGRRTSIKSSIKSPLKNFTDNVNDVIGVEELKAPEYDLPQEQPEQLHKKQSGGIILEDSQYQKLNDLVFDIENDTMNPISKLDISKEDRIIFIAVTFLIRFISLSFVEWGMNTNFISTFEQTFSFYCITYIILFGLITMIVNVVYNYPLQQLYTDSSIVNIQSMLYYFYIYTNGPMRLVLHLIFIIILMIIPLVIKLGNKQSDNANFDYLRKKNTRKALSTFTLVIWIITSIIAMRY